MSGFLEGANNFISSPLGSAVGSVLSDVGSNLFGMWRDKKNRQWQEDMLNKQNEYNLPVNQMERLKSAGLNPNLAFGSAASAMGTSLPSSPAMHIQKVENPSEVAIQAKRANAEIEAAKANVERQREETRRLDLNNQIIESLLTDTIETRKGEMFIERLLQGWNEDHLRELKDLQLTEQEFQNDLLKATKALRDMQRDYTKQQKDNAKQLYDHLVKKYGYEDEYYDMHLNPYETSTPIGFLRTIMGAISAMLDLDPNYFDLPGLHYDRNTGRYVRPER